MAEDKRKNKIKQVTKGNNKCWSSSGKFQKLTYLCLKINEILASITASRGNDHGIKFQSNTTLHNLRHQLEISVVISLQISPTVLLKCLISG